jgi:hypothetical protein
MNLMYGDMWTVYYSVDLFLVTTNAFVQGNGDLVMGKGIARQAKERQGNIAAVFGDIVLSRGGHLGAYGLIVPPTWPRKRIGAFQVKRSFIHKASLELIELSASMLDTFARQHANAEIALNFPGIGNGRLERKDVFPLIEELPDNVHIWQYESQDGDP